MLGSEGATAGFEPVWERILADTLHSVAILPFSPDPPSLGFLARLEIVGRVLSARGFLVKQVDLNDPSQANWIDSLDRSTAVFVAAEQGTLLSGIPDTTSKTLASLYSQVLGAGSLLITGATAAVAIGEATLTQTRRPPKNPAYAGPGIARGIGLLERALVLPYFDQVPEQLVEAVGRLVEKHVRLVGIEQDAALVVGSVGAQCIGLGKVTVLRDNTIEWAGSDGEAAPAGTISITTYR